MADYKVYSAPDGSHLYESPTGSIYRSEAEVVDNEINSALDVISGAGPDALRHAAKNPAAADPKLIASIGVINEVFAQAALAGMASEPEGAPLTPPKAS